MKNESIFSSKKIEISENMNSMTTVVNVKVKYIRPQYKNLKEWCEDPSNVYIGRGGIVFVSSNGGESKRRYPPRGSIFANPFKVGRDGSVDEILVLYKKYITKKIKNGEVTQDDLEGLRGKRLGCWCRPEQKCHGDVLLELLG